MIPGNLKLVRKYCLRGKRVEQACRQFGTIRTFLKQFVGSGILNDEF